MGTYALPAHAFRAIADGRLDLQEENSFRLQTPAHGGTAVMEVADEQQKAWTDYHYVTADIYHEAHDVLVVLFSFTDDKGRTITVHFGVLPQVETRLCLPLAALNGEKLFLDRYPGVMQSVLRGDAFVDRASIKQFAVATVPSITARSFEISKLALSESVPSFNYAYTPYVDQLGQLSWKSWEGKLRDREELAAALHDEWEELQQGNQALDNWSQYGGWKSLRFAATGYFRTHFDGDRWWFVDPDGYALFSTGMDCIHPAGAMRVDGMEHLTPPLPEREGEFADAWIGEGYSFGVANLISAFGANWRGKWKELTEQRLKAWGINTIGNWSDMEFIRESTLPYVYPLSDFPSTQYKIFRDFPDVFSKEYEEQATRFAEQLLPLKDDRRLIGYFLRNEPHWAFVDGLNLTEQLLRSAHRFESKAAFVQWLREKYGAVDQWNAAWDSSFKAFDELYDAKLAAAYLDSGSCPDDFSTFNRMMIRRYVELPSRACKLADPHHLNLGMRYAWVSSEEVLEGCEAFDVFSINCYDMAPSREQIQIISERLNKPLMIGEFHFGAADVGMLAYGIRAVETQADRGLAYQYYVEQAASIPELIGVHYFQLNDQPVLGRFDGENYQIGVVDGCQQPYRPFTEAMARTHARMYEVRTGKTAPLQHCPKEIPRTGF